ncbi:MAG: TadE/TadG family type IV pilus assembly protein, partial [Planctomycetaceae bacterium]
LKAEICGIVMKPGRVPLGRRGAILSMELVLVLPIFLLLIFGIAEFSMLMSAHARVTSAAQSGVRLMSLSGASASEVEERVGDLLGGSLAAGSVINVEPAEYAGQIGRIHVRVPMSSASPDLLWMTGFSLSDRYLESSAAMVVERVALTDGAEADSEPAL